MAAGRERERAMGRVREPGRIPADHADPCVRSDGRLHAARRVPDDRQQQRWGRGREGAAGLRRRGGAAGDELTGHAMRTSIAMIVAAVVAAVAAETAPAQRWLARNPPTSPPVHFRHAMAFDAARGRTVLFGGRGRSAAALADTWEWDGSA